ncbi:MAG: dTMP kinase [Candidatus Sumerlaeia bacterium]
MPESYPGLFIVFEGLDGAGCTTQLSMLESRLLRSGHAVSSTKEPSNGPFGATIRLVIEERLQSDPVALALAFAADRIDHLRNTSNGIIKALQEQKIVLCDRYVLSSLAYQRVFIEDPQWLTVINQFAFSADLTVFIDTPVEVCLQRISARSTNDELFHKASILERVREHYLALIESHHPAAGRIIRVDGTLSREAQHEQIVSSSVALIQEKGYRTLFTTK